MYVIQIVPLGKVPRLARHSVQTGEGLDSFSKPARACRVVVVSCFGITSRFTTHLIRAGMLFVTHPRAGERQINTLVKSSSQPVSVNTFAALSSWV